VSQIKEKVEEKEGIPPVQQRLIHGGKQMYAINPSQSPQPFFLFFSFHHQAQSILFPPPSSESKDIAAY
jgi:hypothetical protein